MSGDLTTGSGRIDKERLNYYKSMIVTRDDLVKQAQSARVDYFKEFGELNSTILAAKIECISKKKAIAYCQTIVNSGGTDVDGSSLQSYLDRCMNDYHESLRKLKKESRLSREAETIPGQTMHRVRKLYRELARLIHPDINPDPFFIPYWHMLKSAYDMCDAERLQELSILIRDAINDHESNTDYVPEDLTAEELEKRIASIEEEIEDIIHNEPYTYSILLDSEDSVKEHRAELNKTLVEYRDYGKELDKVLMTFKIIGGDRLKWIRI